MKARSVLALVLPLALAILACGGGVAPASPPAGVETMVAETFQALTAAAPKTNPQPEANQPAPASESAPQVAPAGLLPRTLYFLKNDSAGLAQIYRLETDGKTARQITFEPAQVDSYDVSAKNGAVVYVSYNQMFMANADGSNRRALLDGGAVDPNNAYLNKIINPVFSPSNETVAYGHKGLNFYSLVTGQTNRVLENQVDDVGNGLLVPREMYWPEQYSADGTKLVVTLGYYEGASAGIYYPAGGTLVRLSNDQNAMICCGETSWSPDGSALYAANPTSGMFSAGLWRVDAATGGVTTLLLGNYETNPAQVADAPFLAPDGNLYYFYASIPNAGEFISRPPLQLVRAGVDGVAGRVVLRPETYENMNEALWSPDGSFVIVALAQTPEAYQGGSAQLVYVEEGQGVISLIPYATRMKWGP